MNLRRKNLRSRSTNLKLSTPNVKLSKRKSTSRSRYSSKVVKLDDLEGSYSMINVEIAKNFENTRIKASKPLLSHKETKHSPPSKYNSRSLSASESCKDPLTSNSFNSSFISQSVTHPRKVKLTKQNCLKKNTLQGKKRKESKSSTEGNPVCIVNLRRKNLRSRSSNLKLSTPNVKLSKRKSTSRSRYSSKVVKLDDLEGSYGMINVEIAKNFESTRIKASKPLLSHKETKHSPPSKYISRFLSASGSCKDPLTSNSFNSSFKPQSVTNGRKRKLTKQNCLKKNTLQGKKRKESKSFEEGKEVCSSSGVPSENRRSSNRYLDTLRLEITEKKTNRYSRRISDKNFAKSNNEELFDCFASENTSFVSPRLAARKKSEDKENERKNGEVSASTGVILKDNNNSLSKRRVKRSKKTETSLRRSERSRISADESSSYSNHNYQDTLPLDTQTHKGNFKTASNRKHSKQNSHQNSSSPYLRFSKSKTNVPSSDNIEISVNDISSTPSKTICSVSRSVTKPKKFTSKGQLQTSKTTSERHLRRNTMPLQKINKKKRKNSKSKSTIDISVNSESPSKTVSQAEEFSYHLNNIPTDDIVKMPFYSPSNITMLRHCFNQKQGKNFTSTPDLKKSTKHQPAKKRGKKLSDSCGSSKKSIPGKGSLKRKRLLINALKEKNEEYEDDIFENCSFGNFKNVLELDDESDTSTTSIATPKCPFLITSSLPVKTPHVKDCYSPLELFKARKVAEEYMYRRNKKWKNSLNSTPNLSKKDTLESRRDETNLRSATSVISEKKKLEFMSVIENYNRKSEELQKEKESDEDEYFSDVSS